MTDDELKTAVIGDSEEAATWPRGGSTQAAEEHVAGRLLDRFLIVRKAGEGGLGKVFVAYDPELDRKVALKLLKARGGAEAASVGRQMLQREAQAMAKLAHPNVVTVYDVGVVGEEVFVAMEYVEGETLRDWLRSAVRSREAILDVMLQAGRGLAAAHAAGIVHRDFKP
ncbi:MAG: protein kinase, partial [Myxococcales bacterium]|nr:protein kinase [Myxococcales bacterium]